MPHKPGTFSDHVVDESSTVGEKLSETAAQVKDKVSDMGRSAQIKLTRTVRRLLAG